MMEVNLAILGLFLVILGICLAAIKVFAEMAKPISSGVGFWRLLWPQVLTIILGFAIAFRHVL